MPSIIERLQEKVSYLKPREIEGILALLLENPGISSNKLIQTTGLPKETLRDFKAAASFLLKATEEDSIYIGEEWKSKLLEENPRQHSWRLVELHNELVAKELSTIRSKHTLKPNRDLDQFFATEQTSIAKALLLDKKGVMDKSKIALLGDDDLVSISTQLLGKTNYKVTVFDADTDLLASISTISKGLGKENIQTIEYDARNNIPSIYKGKFDCVVTDPPYTATGIALFLNRAVELLHVPGDKGGKYIFLYYGTSSKTPEKTLKVQEIINNLGLVIEDRVFNFAQYNGAESIGSNSSVYILKTTQFIKASTQFSDFSHLYTHQQVKEDRFPYVDHVVFKLYSVPKQVIESKSALLKALGDFCNAHKLKVVDEKLTKFKNGGMTITYILSNSNLIVHTWPELNALHVDLITCSPIYDKERLSESLSKLFLAKKIETRVIE